MSDSVILFIGSWFLLGIGAYGLMSSRSFMRIIIALQLMVKGALIMLVIAGQLTGQMHTGQSLAITVITVDTLVMVIGLALAVQIKTNTGTLDVDEIIDAEG